MKRSMLAFAALCGLTAPTWADVLYVNANLATGLDDGSSWSNAYQGSDGLRVALAAAVSGDQVFVAQGTYKPTTGTSRNLSFTMQNGVEVYGGFLGGEFNQHQRPAGGAHATILSGDLAGNDGSNLFNDNTYTLIRNPPGTNATAVLDGFTITGGNANGGGNDRGGGILCTSNVRTTVRDCHFIGNRCTFGGGAGYINGSAPTFTDCSFIDNIGGSFGGAFDMAGAGQVRFTRCWFEGNRASRAGALEVFSTSGPIILNCVFVNNTATGSSGGGGLWFGSGGSSQIINCTIVGNSSPSQASGAGLRNQGSSLTITNCILWDNSGPGGTTTAANQLGGATATYSAIQGITSGTGNIGVDPMFVNQAGGDFTLMDNSPAIDAGNNNNLPAGTLYDFANGRRFDDNATVPDTGIGMDKIVDMGALENTKLIGTYYCPSSGNSNSSGALIFADGSVVAADNDLTLLGTGLPFNQFSIFICGTNREFIASPGVAIGNLCVGGSFGRFNGPGQISDTGATGIAELDIDLNAIAQPMGPTAVMAGETWHFQAWFRDNVFGISLANFTDAVAITFE